MKGYITALCLAAGLFAGGAAEANEIRSVIAVDFLNVEVVMAEPLAAEEMDPFLWNREEAPFRFNEGLLMTGAPVEKEVRGYPNTYRIPVNGLDVGIIYQISYRGQKPKTFKAYDEQELDERYRKRYGDYF